MSALHSLSLVPCFFIAGVLSAVSGCMPGEVQEDAPPTVDINYETGALELLPDSEATQTKGGVTIQVTTIPFQVVEGYVRGDKVVLLPPSMNILGPESYFVERHRTPKIEVTPSTVRFKVKVTNKQERILKLAGSLVSYSASGKQLSVDQAEYADLIGGIVRPNQELEWEVGGPKLELLPNNTNLSFDIYDVVIETDAAGNPTKRENFSWVYQVVKQPSKKTLPLSIKKESVTQAEYYALSARAQ